MKLSEIPCLSFKALRRQLGQTEPHSPMVVPTADSDFCHKAVDCGWLTVEQAAHAAMHYRLGRSRSGRTIFWMIDEWGVVRDGRIGDAWASAMLRQRAPILLKDSHPSHCLFGQHLLLIEPDKEVCIVESERSAVVLSELMPDHIWLATMYPMNLNLLLSLILNRTRPRETTPLSPRIIRLFPQKKPFFLPD